jgi:hypothetical protein
MNFKARELGETRDSGAVEKVPRLPFYEVEGKKG